MPISDQFCPDQPRITRWVMSGSVSMRDQTPPLPLLPLLPPPGMTELELVLISSGPVTWGDVTWCYIWDYSEHNFPRMMAGVSGGDGGGAGCTVECTALCWARSVSVRLSARTERDRQCSVWTLEDHQLAMVDRECWQGLWRRDSMESEVRRPLGPPGVKQTFTWSTPFFDVTFVDIKTKKGNR